MSYAELNIDSKNRMFNYYPKVIQTILEFKAITDHEGQELNDLRLGLDDLISNAYLGTMLEDRIILWESMLGIKPLDGTTFEDRRETVIARIRGQGKLNTELIDKIVNVFTGGTANSWIEDSVLYVEITPPSDNKQFIFENVEQELKNKIPAHLGLKVSRNYYTWGEVKDNHATWGDVKTEFDSWKSVYIFIPFESRIKR
jgi:hypothetical protein